MVNRRSVLKAGVTTVTGVFVNMPRLAWSAAPARAHSTFQRAVFDERFAECRCFADELSSVGVFTAAIGGDVAQLWYGDLRARLSKNHAPVAGMTDRAALFCLEELMREVGMRVIVRVDHVLAHDSGCAEHTTTGPASIVEAARNVTLEPGFGRAMAGLFSRFDIREPRGTAAQKLTGPFSPEGKTALVSWVIA